ncbi:MAG TPA: adenylate/guanylate cyclase domain-containing protein [Burkholderiales bacterium]|nr:adenylate/guanylate cyclase domain-containing protein [Burkholderiales bacterium]
MPLGRIRFATIAVFGLGAFVAASTGITLYLSGAGDLRATQVMLAQNTEYLLDSLERRIDAELEPVRAQSAWVASAFSEGRIDLRRRPQLDAFMTGLVGAMHEGGALVLIDPSGQAQRWTRDRPGTLREDWSGRRNIMDWLERGKTLQDSSWRPPLWAQTRQAAALVYQTPLRRGGRFLGMFGQSVPVARLSSEVAAFGAEHRFTAFILYGDDFVLAHPLLAATQGGVSRANPLPSVLEVGDPVLARLQAQGAATPISMRALTRSHAVGAKIGDSSYVYVYRQIPGTGATPWNLGIYINAERGDQGAEMRRLALSLGAGLAVLALAVLAAALAGRRLSGPVEALARAAAAVREDRLEDVPVLPESRIAEFDEANRSFNQMVEGLRERSIIRATLGRLLPEEVARRLLAEGGRLEPAEAKATVLLCDIEDFTQLTDSLGPQGVIEFLNAYFAVAGDIVERHRGVITQFQGDAVLAVFNLPLADPDHGANALRAAIELVRAADERDFAGVRVRNRVGISTGQVVAGAVGSRGRLSYTVHGNAVNLASRIEALNKEYGTRILLAEKTAERCPGFDLAKVAEAEIRGYGEKVPLYTPRTNVVP